LRAVCLVRAMLFRICEPGRGSAFYASRLRTCFGGWFSGKANLLSFRRTPSGGTLTPERTGEYLRALARRDGCCLATRAARVDPTVVCLVGKAIVRELIARLIRMRLSLSSSRSRVQMSDNALEAHKAAQS